MLTQAEVYWLTLAAAMILGGFVVWLAMSVPASEVWTSGRRKPRTLEPRAATGGAPGAAGAWSSGAAPGTVRTSALLGAPDTWTRGSGGVLHPPVPPARPVNGRSLGTQPRRRAEPTPRRQAGPRPAPQLLTPEQLTVHERVARGLRNLDRPPVYGEAPQLVVDQAQRPLGRADLGPADTRPFRDRVRPS